VGLGIQGKKPRNGVILLISYRPKFARLSHVTFHLGYGPVTKINLPTQVMCRQVLVLTDLYTTRLLYDSNSFVKLFLKTPAMDDSMKMAAIHQVSCGTYVN
jgi:hypothetical protein